MQEIASWKVKREEELPEIASKLIDIVGKERLFCFFGEMGSGKTTFIKTICRQLGVKDQMSSPTFALVNEYHSEKGEIIYHFDFYRIDSEEEALNIGFEEYLDSGNHCFIEWPEKIDNLLPENYVKVSIEEINQLRTISISK